MKLFKNRTVLGIFCIAVSLIICFAITPLVNAGLSKKVTIVRFNRQVNEGEEITRSMLDEVEVGNHNLPENVIRNIADMEGKYLTTTVYAGDYILTDKISNEPAAENKYLYSLNGEKQAMSITINTFAEGLSGKLKSGDIVSVIAPDYLGSGETIIPVELKYVEVIAVTAKSGYDANTGEKLSEEEEKELPSTVTILVRPEQSKLLARLEAEGEIHLSLVFRGDADKASERMDVHENKSGTLLAHGRSNPPIIMATSQGNAEIGIGYCPTITAAAGMAGNNQPILFDNHGPDTRYTGPVEVAQTITSALGTGGNNTPLAVNKEPFCIAGNIVNRKEKNGGNGCGYQQGISYTLTTEDRHCVYNPENTLKPYQQVIGSLCAGDEKMISNQYVDQGKCIVDTSSLVRRLIPLECERLMGFPDYWTDIPGASDSARYRALGNSVAMPCVDYILCGIAFYLREQ